jgi:predicted enzyme related to lactoylglutathione lyase
MKIALVSVLVDDPIKAFHFYTEKLGFVERMFMPEAMLAIVASPEDPNGTGLLLEPNSNPIAKPFQEGVYEQGMPIIIFGVEDCQQEYEKLKARGVIFRQGPTTEEWGTQAILEDGCGNLIQIHQAPS